MTTSGGSVSTAAAQLGFFQRRGGRPRRSTRRCNVHVCAISNSLFTYVCHVRECVVHWALLPPNWASTSAEEGDRGATLDTTKRVCVCVFVMCAYLCCLQVVYHQLGTMMIPKPPVQEALPRFILRRHLHQVYCGSNVEDEKHTINMLLQHVDHSIQPFAYCSCSTTGLPLSTTLLASRILFLLYDRSTSLYYLTM
jgi:hypothetical protein